MKKIKIGRKGQRDGGIRDEGAREREGGNEGRKCREGRKKEGGREENERDYSTIYLGSGIIIR